MSPRGRYGYSLRSPPWRQSPQKSVVTSKIFRRYPNWGLHPSCGIKICHLRLCQHNRACLDLYSYFSSTHRPNHTDIQNHGPTNDITSSPAAAFAIGYARVQAGKSRGRHTATRNLGLCCHHADQAVLVKHPRAERSANRHLDDDTRISDANQLAAHRDQNKCVHTHILPGADRDRRRPHEYRILAVNRFSPFSCLCQSGINPAQNGVAYNLPHSSQTQQMSEYTFLRVSLKRSPALIMRPTKCLKRSPASFSY